MVQLYVGDNDGEPRGLLSACLHPHQGRLHVLRGALTAELTALVQDLVRTYFDADSPDEPSCVPPGDRYGFPTHAVVSFCELAAFDHNWSEDKGAGRYDVGWVGSDALREVPLRDRLAAYAHAIAQQEEDPEGTLQRLLGGKTGANATLLQSVSSTRALLKEGVGPWIHLVTAWAHLLELNIDEAGAPPLLAELPQQLEALDLCNAKLQRAKKFTEDVVRAATLAHEASPVATKIVALMETVSLLRAEMAHRLRGGGRDADGGGRDGSLGASRFVEHRGDGGGAQMQGSSAAASTRALYHSAAAAAPWQQQHPHQQPGSQPPPQQFFGGSSGGGPRQQQQQLYPQAVAWGQAGGAVGAGGQQMLSSYGSTNNFGLSSTRYFGGGGGAPVEVNAGYQ